MFQESQADPAVHFEYYSQPWKDAQNSLSTLTILAQTNEETCLPCDGVMVELKGTLVNLVSYASK